jgi:hypothetical protein
VFKTKQWMIHEVKAVQEWYACKVKVTSPLTKEDIRSVVREAVWEREEHIADRLRFAGELGSEYCKCSPVHLHAVDAVPDPERRRRVRWTLPQ